MAEAPALPARLLTSAEVAEYLGVPTGTLAVWRHRGTGPRFFKVGKYARYDLLDLRKWLEGQADTHLTA